MTKTRVFETADFPTSYRISKYGGVCKHCGERYYAGDKVNWNPRVKNTCCHAGCYSSYGSPVQFDGYTNQTGNNATTTSVTSTHEVEEIQEVHITTENGATIGEQLARAIEPYLNKRLESVVTEDKVKSIVEKLFDGMVFKSVHTYEVFDKEGDFTFKRDMGVQHKNFGKLLNLLKAKTVDGYRLNVWLAGPAGTGKTTAAKKAAEALGLDFYFTGAIDTEYKLLGFVDAQSRLVNTQFRQAYEHGGVFLMDEVDGSLPPAILALNAALANGECAFPDGIVTRHPDFVCIAAANTWGLGATHEYVGRMKLDAASLDRFVTLDWPIDEELEYALATNQQWFKRVQKVRANIKAKGIKVMVTPRATIFGCALLAAGVAWDEVEIATLRKAMTDEQWSSVRY